MKREKTYNGEFTILVPYSPTQFYARGSEYRKVEFVLDDMDNVTGLTFKECVVELKAKRID